MYMCMNSDILCYSATLLYAVKKAWKEMDVIQCKLAWNVIKLISLFNQFIAG